MKSGDWYKIVTDVISGLSALATISMAIMSGCTLHFAKVERAEVNDIRQKTEQQTASIQDALDRISLHEDIAAAGGGDRFAYVRATKLLWEQEKAGDGKAEALLQKLRFSTERFMVAAEEKTSAAAFFLSWSTITENDDKIIVAMLQDRLAKTRIDGLMHILALRKNGLLPSVVRLLEKEPDLTVVQMAVKVINDAFLEEQVFNHIRAFSYFSVDDCVFHHDEFKESFETLWNANKDVLLGRPQKEVRRGKDKNAPHRDMIYIYDPEKPDDIPVENP